MRLTLGKDGRVPVSELKRVIKALTAVESEPYSSIHLEFDVLKGYRFVTEEEQVHSLPAEARILWMGMIVKPIYKEWKDCDSWVVPAGFEFKEVKK